MSMRNIKVVLECLRNGITPLPDGQVFHDFVKEVEAIERACVFVVRESAITDVENEHVDVIRSIARDAP